VIQKVMCGDSKARPVIGPVRSRGKRAGILYDARSYASIAAKDRHLDGDM